MKKDDMKKDDKKVEIETRQQCAFKVKAITDALYAIGGKWKLPIIHALSEGTNRFNELLRTIEGISSRVLASELKQLELNGFATRKVQPGPPVVVEYELTEYSQSLKGVLEALFEWGANHRERIKQQLHEPVNSDN